MNISYKGIKKDSINYFWNTKDNLKGNKKILEYWSNILQNILYVILGIANTSLLILRLNV